MRLFIAFFLSLCFFLLKGESNARAESLRDQVWHLTSSKPAKTPQTNIKSSRPHETVKEYFFNIEDEDEDISFLRKNVIVAHYFIVIGYGFIFSYFLSCLKRLSFGRYLPHTSSFKYITLRVLRI